MTLRVFAWVCLCSALTLLSATLSANEAILTTPGGLKYRDLQVGSGPAATIGQIAVIHFVGWIDQGGTRGKKIYNSRDLGQPTSFVIGTDMVMEGWNEGVIGMKPGGRRLLMIPARLGYGAKGVDDMVPANANLIFVIELLKLGAGH